MSRVQKTPGLDSARCAVYSLCLLFSSLDRLVCLPLSLFALALSSKLRARRPSHVSLVESFVPTPRILE